MLGAVLASINPMIRRRWSLWVRTGLLMGVFDRSNVHNAVQRIQRDLHMNSAERYVSRNTQRTADLAARAQAILWPNGSPLVYQQPDRFQYDPFIHGMIDVTPQLATACTFAMRAYSEGELRAWYNNATVRLLINAHQDEESWFANLARQRVISSACLWPQLHALTQRASELELRRDIDPYSCTQNGITFECGIPPEDARSWALMTMLGDPRAARFVWESQARGLDRWYGMVQAIVFNAPTDDRAVSDALFDRLVELPSLQARWHNLLWQNYAQAQRGDDIKWMYFDPIQSDFRRQQPNNCTKNAIIDTSQDPAQPNSQLYFQRAFSAAMPLINRHIASRAGNPQFRPSTHVLLRYVLGNQGQNATMTNYRRTLINNWPFQDGVLRWFQIHGDGTWFEVEDNNDDFHDDVDRPGFTRNDFNQFMARNVPMVAYVAYVRWQRADANCEIIWDRLGITGAVRTQNQLVNEEDMYVWNDPQGRNAFPRVTHSGVFRSYVFAQYVDPATQAAKSVGIKSVDRARPLLVMPYLG